MLFAEPADVRRTGVSRVTIDKRLLEILRCPACYGEISPQPDDAGLECLDCGRVYPIRDGIPVMLVEEASPPTRGDSETDSPRT